MRENKLYSNVMTSQSNKQQQKAIYIYIVSQKNVPYMNLCLFYNYENNLF